MEVKSLKELYLTITNHYSKVFVVPIIRFKFPQTDYLYLLYKELLAESEDYEIHSISVFNHYKFVISAIIHRNSILHYHWVEYQNTKALVAMPYKLLCIALFKFFGGNIVWTIHNIAPHDKKYLSLHHTIHKWLAGKAAVIHVHSQSAIPIVKEYLQTSEEKIYVLEHPDFPSTEMKKQTAIDEFLNHYGEGRTNLVSPTILIFGGISEYKGIREIIDILSTQKKDFSLIIAGYVKIGQEPLHRFIIDKTIQDDRVIYVPCFIPEEHYPSLLHSADICVFNYDAILTSGGVSMALAYQKEVIAPNKGCLQDLKDEERVSLFNTKEELQLLLQRVLDREPNV